MNKPTKGSLAFNSWFRRHYKGHIAFFNSLPDIRYAYEAGRKAERRLVAKDIRKYYGTISLSVAEDLIKDIYKRAKRGR